MALQTIGGSSLVSKGAGNMTSTKERNDSGVVKIERSWKVESNSRSRLVPDDGDSEELILGSIGFAEVDSDLERQK